MDFQSFINKNILKSYNLKFSNFITVTLLELIEEKESIKVPSHEPTYNSYYEITVIVHTYTTTFYLVSIRLFTLKLYVVKIYNKH